MHGLFGEIQISEEAHQRRENPARFRPVKGLNDLAEMFGHRRRHLRQASKREWLDTTALGLLLSAIYRVCDLLRVVNQRSIAKSLIGKVLGGRRATRTVGLRA